MMPTAFSRINKLSGMVDVIQYLRVEMQVIDDNLSPLETLHAFNREKTYIAGPGANEIDFAFPLFHEIKFNIFTCRRRTLNNLLFHLRGEREYERSRERILSEPERKTGSTEGISARGQQEGCPTIPGGIAGRREAALAFSALRTTLAVFAVSELNASCGLVVGFGRW
jgi:hypothetical protein